MIITDDEANDLKTWVIQKLEDISDADSDVLADYVLALIRADTSEPELKANAVENLDDFLKENTALFVDELFHTVHARSYIPGYIAPSVPALSTPAFAPPLGPASLQALVNGRGGFGRGQPLQQQPHLRKRTYNDWQEANTDFDPHYVRDERQMKQLRRGGMGNSAGRGYPGANGNSFQARRSLPGISSPPGPFPSLPAPPLGMPFDHNDPIAALLAMQAAMGLPPRMPAPPAGLSPAGFPVQTPPAPGRIGKTKIDARCRDYDTKGYCTRGSACPFDHGNNQIIVPAGQEEYDPKDSLMLDLHAPAIGPRTQPLSDVYHGQNQARGHGRGRGDRGAFTPQRRGRAEFSQAGPNHDRSITTVVVEQIPEENFEEQAVRDFFSAFGKIEEVTMQAYKRLALVKFDDYPSAKRAYESPRVIFDNRFVKVYWHQPAPAAENGHGPPKPNPATSPTSKPEEPAYDMEKFSRDAEAAQKKLEDRKALMRSNDAKKAELEKQREVLVRKQAEEKAKLEEKLRAKGLSLADAMAVDTPAKDAPAANGSADAKPSTQTEMLRASLKALEDEAKSLGLNPEPWAEPTTTGWGRGRGRGSYWGGDGFAGYDSSRGGYRGRGGSFRGSARGGGAYNLDNRPKKVRVEGVVFDGGADEGLRQYLLGIGEFASLEPAADKSSLLVAFKDRFTAERFFYGTKDIPNVGRVDFAWVSEPLAPVNGAVAKNGDMEMADGDGNADGEVVEKAPAASGTGVDGKEREREVDYDVAEEDDRWVVT